MSKFPVEFRAKPTSVFWAKSESEKYGEWALPRRNSGAANGEKDKLREERAIARLPRKVSAQSLFSVDQKTTEPNKTEKQI